MKYKKHLKLKNNISLEKLIKEYGFEDKVFYISKIEDFDLGFLQVSIELRIYNKNREIELNYFLDSEENDIVVAETLDKENNFFLCVLFDLIKDDLIEKV